MDAAAQAQVRKEKAPHLPGMCGSIQERDRYANVGFLSQYGKRLR